MIATKPQLRVLEAAFAAEIDGALRGGPRVYQPRGRDRATAMDLTDLGLLDAIAETVPGWPPVVVSGYVLTERGRIIYCASLPADDGGAE